MVSNNWVPHRMRNVWILQHTLKISIGLKEGDFSQYLSVQHGENIIYCTKTRIVTTKHRMKLIKISRRQPPVTRKRVSNPPSLQQTSLDFPLSSLSSKKELLDNALHAVDGLYGNRDSNPNPETRRLPMVTEKQIENAKEIVAYYTLAAAATGAIPVPASSAAIIAENGLMLGHIQSALGETITVSSLSKSIGYAAGLNIVGRTLFIEGAKLLAWGTGSVWAASALSALGAGTAKLQTYIIGCIAIEIARNSGKPLDRRETGEIIDDCKASYDSFLANYRMAGKNAVAG